MTRAFAAALIALASLASSACGIAVGGDFDGVPFFPDRSVLAVADRQDLLDRAGAVVPVLRSPSSQTLSIVLTGARFDPDVDWRNAPEDRALEARRDLATSDGILLRGVSLQKFAAGDALTATLDNGIVTGDFDLAVGSALPPEDQVKARGLGAKLNVSIEPKGVDAKPHGGSVSASIEVQREREAGQETDVATGTVNVAFSASLSPERLGESNVAFAAPVLACMMQLGPAHAGECRDAAALAVVDETGVQP